MKLVRLENGEMNVGLVSLSKLWYLSEACVKDLEGASASKDELKATHEAAAQMHANFARSVSLELVCAHRAYRRFPQRCGAMIAIAIEAVTKHVEEKHAKVVELSAQRFAGVSCEDLLFIPVLHEARPIGHV
eukprot:4687947-Amphidinium_carterae.1